MGDHRSWPFHRMRKRQPSHVHRIRCSHKRLFASRPRCRYHRHLPPGSHAKSASPPYFETSSRPAEPSPPRLGPEWNRPALRQTFRRRLSTSALSFFGRLHGRHPREAPAPHSHDPRCGFNRRHCIPFAVGQTFQFVLAASSLHHGRQTSPQILIPKS